MVNGWVNTQETAVYFLFAESQSMLVSFHYDHNHYLTLTNQNQTLLLDSNSKEMTNNNQDLY